MSLKSKLLITAIGMHLALFIATFALLEELGAWIVVIEAILLLSLAVFYKLISKAVEPLDHITTFSNLLKEQEFTARFHPLKQKDLNNLVEQFNEMLSRLYNERLRMGEQHRVLEKLMQESPIAVLLLDYDGNVSKVNPACEVLLSLSRPNAIIGQKLVEVRDRKDLVARMLHVPVDGSKLLKLDDGKQIKISHFEIRDRGCKRSFYMMTELTQEILSSQKLAYEKLIRLMSHEVNNTIASTNSLLASCLDFSDELDTESSNEFEQAINIVIKRSTSLNQFMQAYANVVKLEKPIKSQFDLPKMLRGLCTLYYAQCQQRNITMQYVGPETFSLYADPNLFEQALVNIIKNAIEAIGSPTPEEVQDAPSHKIELSLIVTDDNKKLEITDSGAGISQEVQAQLFSPFFTSKDSGQGIGLMLVREILDMHDIAFSLKNCPDDVGAVFTIEL